MPDLFTLKNYHSGFWQNPWIFLIASLFFLPGFADSKDKLQQKIGQESNRELTTGAAVSSGVITLTGFYTGLGLATYRHYAGVLYMAYSRRESEGTGRWMAGGGAEYATILRPLPVTWFQLRPGLAAGYWYNERTGKRSGSEEYYLMPRAGVLLGMHKIFLKLQYGALIGEDVKHQLNLLGAFVF